MLFARRHWLAVGSLVACYFVIWLGDVDSFANADAYEYLFKMFIGVAFAGWIMACFVMIAYLYDYLYKEPVEDQMSICASLILLSGAYLYGAIAEPISTGNWWHILMLMPALGLIAVLYVIKTLWDEWQSLFDALDEDEDIHASFTNHPD